VWEREDIGVVSSMYFLLETKIISVQIPVSGRFCHAVLAVRDIILFTECGEASNNRDVVYIQHKDAGKAKDVISQEREHTFEINR
jgi:hypothetical protein